VLDPPFRPDEFVKPCSGNRKCQRAFVSGTDLERSVRKRLAASGGGHTLRFHDLGMILAWHRNGVCDGAHSAFVMKKTGSGARVAEGGARS